MDAVRNKSCKIIHTRDERNAQEDGIPRSLKFVRLVSSLLNLFDEIILKHLVYDKPCYVPKIEQFCLGTTIIVLDVYYFGLSIYAYTCPN